MSITYCYGNNIGNYYISISHSQDCWAMMGDTNEVVNLCPNIRRLFISRYCITGGFVE